ncbi:MAG: protoporphyrinogen oxidase [Bacteroidetes bacterium]|nr:protoporphyrinogen oxidase [Bacteroidota bacterium]
MRKQVDYLVLGAGISGMGAAWELDTRGKEFLVVEKNLHPGGVLQSKLEDGYLYELGPNTAALSPEYEGFLSYLGLNPLMPELASSKRMLWQEKGLVEVKNSLPALLKADWLSWKGKLRLLTEPFRKKGTSQDESVYSFISRRLGEEVAEKLVDPVFRGIYASEIRELSSFAVIPALKKGEQKYGSLFRYLIKTKPKMNRKISAISGGFKQIGKAFEEKMGERFKGGIEVTRIDKRDHTFVIEANSSDGPFTIECQNLVSSLPAYISGELFKNTYPDLARLLASIPYHRLTVAHMDIESDKIQHIPAAFGFLVPGYMGKRIAGVMFNSHLFRERSKEGFQLLSVFCDAVDEDELNEVKAELADALRINSENIHLRNYHVWSAALPAFGLGYPKIQHGIKEILKTSPGLEMAGNYLGKVSLSDSLVSGMNAAITFL